MPWVSWVLVSVVLVVLGLWLWWTAHRLDQMHHRIEVARAALDAQLLRRSGAALELAISGTLDPARSLLLVDAAHHARAAAVEDLESAESDLSETLRAVLADPDELDQLRSRPELAPLLEELAACTRKVELARRFHNDVVVSARSLRGRRRVRWLQLAGRAAELGTVDLDDVPPQALVRD
jgi:hypothetical protein